MRQKSLILSFLFALAALPSFAGIHYKAVTKTEDATNQAGDIAVEGWVAGDKAKVEFEEANKNNPMAKKGAYLITKDGGRTIYFVDPSEKTYAEWDLQAMMGMVGSVMQGMGPLLKVEFTDPKVEKLLEENGGTISGLPTTHYRYRTSYNMKIKVMGMGQEANVVTEQDVWATDKLQDVGLGIWLRNEPPRTGNANFDKLIAGEMERAKGFPLKTVTVSTTTQKKGKQTVTRSTMEVTQLDTSADVPASSFEIPAGYQETQLLPTAEAGAAGEDEEEQGLGALLRNRKKKDGGDGQ